MKSQQNNGFTWLIRIIVPGEGNFAREENFARARRFAAELVGTVDAIVFRYD